MMLPGIFSSAYGLQWNQKAPVSGQSTQQTCEAWKPLETFFSGPSACSIRCQVHKWEWLPVRLWWFSEKAGSFFLKVWVHRKQMFYVKWTKSPFCSSWRSSEPRWLKSIPLNGRGFSIYLRIQALLLHSEFHVARSNPFSAFSLQGPCRLQFLQAKRRWDDFPQR